MQLPQQDYYAIQDISDTSRTPRVLQVVSEYDNRAEAEIDARGRKVGNCEVYFETERDGKRYRVICEKKRMVSDVRP